MVRLNKDNVQTFFNDMGSKESWGLNINRRCRYNYVGGNVWKVWINFERTHENDLMISLRCKGEGVEQGFLNVFLFCEKLLIDKFYLERYLTITLMIIEDQKLNIYENNLMISGGAEQGF